MMVVILTNLHNGRIMSFVRQKQASTTHVKQVASSTTLVKQKATSTTFVKFKERSDNVLETIWDGGNTLWDLPEPRTIWDKYLNQGYFPIKQASTTYVKQKEV